MDGTVAPIRAMVDAMDEIFPARNAHLVVDEAHTMGIYGPGGRGMVAQLGAGGPCACPVAHLWQGPRSVRWCVSSLFTVIRVLNELRPSAVILTNTLILDYLLNYTRPLIYTTSLSNAAIIAASYLSDLLEDGMAEKVLSSSHPFAIRLPA